MILSVILTLFFIYNFYIYSSISSNNKIYNIKKENELSSVNKNQSFNNVYFILFDAMMPIEEFVKHENLNVENVIAGFDQSYKYIKGSISNYDNTRLSLTSTFTNSYFLDDKSSKFKNYDNFYPYFLYNKEKTNQLSLVKLLKKKQSRFYLVWQSSLSLQKCYWYYLWYILKYRNQPCKRSKDFLRKNSNNYNS